MATELTRTDVVETMRPNLFANTPDILNEYLQVGGPSAFQIRLVPGPAALGVNLRNLRAAVRAMRRHVPWKSGSRKISRLREVPGPVARDLDAPGNLRTFVALINAIRRDNRALHTDRSLRFVPTDNDQVIAYLKTSPDNVNAILTVVNLNPHYTHSGWVRVPVWELSLNHGDQYQVHDLIQRRP